METHLGLNIIEKILNRQVYSELSEYQLKFDGIILITGAKGSIGIDLVNRLNKSNVKFYATDIDELDITKENEVKNLIETIKPDVIINIAGAKHAPLGEVDIEETLKINTLGVINLLKHKGKAKLIQCSTCKSANPETVYGASKLIAERLVLNSGGIIARFFNVIETSGNVFEIWKNKDIIEVASNCQRYFISLSEASGLLLKCINLKSGRYLVNSPNLINMLNVANSCYPEKTKKIISQRRGDRLTEIFLATNETIDENIGLSIIKVLNSHDIH